MSALFVQIPSALAAIAAAVGETGVGVDSSTPQAANKSIPTMNRLANKVDFLNINILSSLRSGR
jgi:hypothetical protein